MCACGKNADLLQSLQMSDSREELLANLLSFCAECVLGCRCAARAASAAAIDSSRATSKIFMIAVWSRASPILFLSCSRSLISRASFMAGRRVAERARLVRRYISHASYMHKQSSTHAQCVLLHYKRSCDARQLKSKNQSVFFTHVCNKKAAVP